MLHGDILDFPYLSAQRKDSGAVGTENHHHRYPESYTRLASTAPDRTHAMGKP